MGVQTGYTEQQWALWRFNNGYSVFDEHAEGTTSMWIPDQPTQTLPATPEQLFLIDPHNKSLRSWTRKDFLVDKRVIVTGAQEYKGMKGRVLDVNIPLRTAQVSLDAHTLVANKYQTISLNNLMLDMSKER